jgi:hypothetical protein
MWSIKYDPKGAAKPFVALAGANFFGAEFNEMRNGLAAPKCCEFCSTADIIFDNQANITKKLLGSSLKKGIPLKDSHKFVLGDK